jgi:succinoglycan biosynthesis transport protein ExoP
MSGPEMLPRSLASVGPANGAAPAPLPGAAAWSGERPASPPALSAAPTAAALWHALRRRWLAALLLAILGALAAMAVVVVLIPGQYTAVALLQVSARSPSLAALLGEAEAPADPATVRSNQAPIITSLPVLQAALQRPEVAALPSIQEKPQPAAWLAQTLKIEFKGAEILELRLSGSEPDEVQALVNAVAEEYARFMMQREEKRRQSLLKQLEENFANGEKSLADKRQRLLQMLHSLKIDEPETARSRYEAALRELQDVQKEERTLQQEAIRLQNELTQLQKWIADLPQRGLDDALIDKHLQDDPLFKQYLLDLAKVEDEIRKTQASYVGPRATEEIGVLQQYRQELLTGLAKYRQAQLPRVRTLLRAEAEQNLTKLQVALSGVQQRQEFLRSERRRLEEDVRQLTPTGRASSAAVEALRQEILLQEEALKTIGTKMELLKVAPALGAPVTLVQPAAAPRVLDRSRQTKLAAVAGVGVFWLLLLGVAWMEFRRRCLTSAREVVEGLGLPLAGTLPALPLRWRRPAVSGGEHPVQVRFREAVDTLRTLLLSTRQNQEFQVLLITSAEAREGKTSLACQLAASLARAWRKTLLVDGDLRHPVLHRLFGISAEPGLSEVLRGEARPAEVVRSTALSRLWVLPAGRPDSHACQALAVPEQLTRLFEELKGQYDFILLDASPVLPVTDALLLAQQADAVLLALRRQVSRAPAVYAAWQRLQGLGVHVLGGVLIGGNPDLDGPYCVYPSRPAG